MSILLRIILYGTNFNENFTAFLFLFFDSSKACWNWMLVCFLSENIKTPISKDLVIGKAWYSINIRHFNECQFVCLHRHVCNVEVSVSMQRPGVRVRYCPQLFSAPVFEARSWSLPGVSLAIYSPGDPPLRVSWELWFQVPPCLPCFHVGSGDPDSSPLLARQPLHLLAHLPRPW